MQLDQVARLNDERLATLIDGSVRAALEQWVRALEGRVISPRIKFLDIDRVSEATSLAKSTIYGLVAQGRFPKPQKNLGKNLWRESTLIAWADANDPNRPTAAPGRQAYVRRRVPGELHPAAARM